MIVSREKFVDFLGHLELKYVVIKGKKSVPCFSNAFEFCFNLNCFSD